jgi:hypothetical protein
MRQGPHPKRGRGRGGNRRSGPPNRNHTFDSNGPDIRIRGNAHQVHEKYMNLARDASTNGEVVLAEGYFQHAEHYYRILSTFTDETNSDANRNRNSSSGNSQNNTQMSNITETDGEPVAEQSVLVNSTSDGSQTIDKSEKISSEAKNEAESETEQSKIMDPATPNQPTIALRSRQRVSSNEEHPKIKDAPSERISIDDSAVELSPKEERPVRPRRRPKVATKSIKETSSTGIEKTPPTTDVD